jgi:PTH1 family peptidyl-tRNA hydrolase
MAASRSAGVPESPDFVVLGLGNPGEKYRDTRHNFGFLVTEALARAGGESLREGPGPSLIAGFTVGPSRGILAQPCTWMNRSGIAAREIVDRYGNPGLDRLLVVTDDLDLPLGRIRFRRGGGPGGHNGLRSLIEELRSSDFPRLRLGIGRPDRDEREDVVDWVLEPFAPEEREVVQEVVQEATKGVRVFVEEGVEAAMNRFNAGRAGGSRSLES